MALKTVPLWKIASTKRGSWIDCELIGVYTDQPIPAELEQTPMHIVFADIPKGSDVDRAYVAIRRGDLAVTEVPSAPKDVADQ